MCCIKLSHKSQQQQPEQGGGRLGQAQGMVGIGYRQIPFVFYILKSILDCNGWAQIHAQTPQVQC